MRKIMIGAGALMLAACVHPEGRDANVAAANHTPEQAGRIIMSELSNVCVTVDVDQRIWPQPITPDSRRNFSGSLMAELRKLYEQRGGSHIIPGTPNKTRFYTNANGTTPECQDRENDVFVVAHYGPRADGTAFVFDYRIERGAVSRSGEIEVDVAAGIRAGRIRGFTQRRTMTAVIYEDLLSRAPMILDQLTIQHD